MGILNLDIRTGCNLKERNHVGIRPVSDENRADDSEHAVKMGKFYHCSVSQLHAHNLGSAVAGLGMGDMANFKRYVDSLEADFAQAPLITAVGDLRRRDATRVPASGNAASSARGRGKAARGGRGGGRGRGGAGAASIDDALEDERGSDDDGGDADAGTGLSATAERTIQKLKGKLKEAAAAAVEEKGKSAKLTADNAKFKRDATTAATTINTKARAIKRLTDKQVELTGELEKTKRTIAQADESKAAAVGAKSAEKNAKITALDSQCSMLLSLNQTLTKNLGSASSDAHNKRKKATKKKKKKARKRERSVSVSSSEEESSDESSEEDSSSESDGQSGESSSGDESTTRRKDSTAKKGKAKGKNKEKKQKKRGKKGKKKPKKHH